MLIISMTSHKSHKLKYCIFTKSITPFPKEFLRRQAQHLNQFLSLLNHNLKELILPLMLLKMR